MGTARHGGVGPSRPRKAEEVLLRMLSGSHVDPAPTGVSLRQKTAPRPDSSLLLRQLPPPSATASSLGGRWWVVVASGAPSPRSCPHLPSPRLTSCVLLDPFQAKRPPTRRGEAADRLYPSLS